MNEPLPLSQTTYVVNPARALVQSKPLQLFFVLIFHMALGLVFAQVSLIALAHSLVVVLAGVFFLIRDKEPYNVIYVTAYIAGMEVLWRIAGGTLVWEYSKYSIALLLILSLLKAQKLRQVSLLPILYFVLLIPSISIMPVFSRNDISFNLSGPLLLAIAAASFSTFKLERKHVQNVTLALIFPVLSLLILATFGLVTAVELEFTNEANFEASAGYGPNQVSTIFGLGLLGIWIYIFMNRNSRFIQGVLLICWIWLAVQTLLTFSRGGLWAGLGGIAITALFFVQNKRARWNFVGIIFLFAVVGNFYIFPALDDFTDGALTDRFQSTDLTGRDVLWAADLEIFWSNIALGVGPGQGRLHRYELVGRGDASHTEYARLLSEHGLFGVFAMVVLAIICIQRVFLYKETPFARGVTLAFIAWALLTLAHSAMRLALPGFIFGLAMAQFDTNVSTDPEKVEDVVKHKVPQLA